MALISLRQLLDHAAEHDYRVPAFNVNNLEQVRAIMEGAADQISKIKKVYSLEEMHHRYAESS